MPKFSYQAMDAEHQQVSGDLEAGSLSEAISLLEARQLSIQLIQQLDAVVSSGTLPSSPHHAAQKSSLLEPLEQALQQRDQLLSQLEAFAAEAPTTRCRGDLPLLIESIRRGTTAEQLLSHFPSWVPLLVSGTESASIGSLADSLEQAAYQRDHRSRAWRFLLYPLLILALAFGVLLLLSWMIIPEFSSMYKEFGLRLPQPTAFLLAFSDWLVQFPEAFFAIVALVTVGMVALVWAWGHNKMSYRIFERVPARERADSLACLTSHLASLLDAGSPLNEALDVAARSELHPHYQTAAKTLGYQAANRSVPADDLLPPNVIYALGIGLNPSPNIRLLQELARSYRERGHEQNVGWHGLVAAFSIIAVGLVVGWVVLALFMPLVSLISGLT